MNTFVFLVFLTQLAFGQYDNAFVGKWSVVSSSSTGIDQAVSDEHELAQIFLDSEIDFRSNGDFQLTLTSRNEFAADLAKSISVKKQ